jgi:hypothetical protein
MPVYRELPCETKPRFNRPLSYRASGCDLDLSSSLFYVTATLSDVRVNLQRVLTSIEGNKPAAMVRAG